MNENKNTTYIILWDLLKQYQGEIYSTNNKPKFISKQTEKRNTKNQKRNQRNINRNMMENNQ